MSYSRLAYKLVLVVTLANLCLGFGSLPAVYAQQSSNIVAESRERGISLYNKGDDRGAIDALRTAVKQRKDDLLAWHYLGLALQRQGKTSDARKAHEKAARLGEQFLEHLFESDPNGESPLGVEKVKPLLEAAAASAQRFSELNSKLSRAKAEEWSARIELLSYYARLSAGTDGGVSATRVYKASEVSTKARILARFEPQYTEEAREHHVSGTIILRAVLASDGKVRAIRVVRGLPHGLNWMAMKALQRLRFEPAMMGTTPVSQYIQVEFSFHIF